MSRDGSISVVGANGKLGSLIVTALARRGARVRAVVRPGREDSVAHLAGPSTSVVTARLEDRDTLEAICAGASTVISAVQGDPDIIVDGQLALLAAARAHGVTRFVPSDFSFDIFGLPAGNNINSDWRRTFAEEAAKARGAVQVVHVMNGCFIDRDVLFGFLGAIDTKTHTLQLWGDGKAPMDFTTFEDAAAYTAAMVLDKRDVPERFYVAGEVADAIGLARSFERGSGQRLEVVERGTLDDLDREIARRQSEDPSNFYAYLPLMYWRAMLDGTGKAPQLHNDRHPEITPTSIEAYVSAMTRGQ